MARGWVSYIEHSTRRVMVSVRHLVTGHVSHVELSDVVFGVDAERWAAEQLRAQELMVESKKPETLNLEPVTPPGGVVVTLPVMCAWCRLWRVDSVWTPIAPANVSKVSHGICPPCAAKMLAEVAA